MNLAPPGARWKLRRKSSELCTGLQRAQPGADPGHLAQPQEPGNVHLLRPPAKPEDIEAKKQIILRHGLALWDTLESCTITGASDASIRDVVPNDIAGLLAKAPIEAVFCNGATAYKIYTKYLEPVSGIPAVRLPSTSPANAACRPEKLREIWNKELSNWILP